MNIQPIYGDVTRKVLAGNIAANRRQMMHSLRKMASGQNILSAGDAPADLAMSERLRSLISRYDAAIGNTENAVSYLKTSDGFLQSMQDSVGRMQELAVAANDGTKSDADRQLLSLEFNQLKEGINSITGGSSPAGSFNGKALFQGDSISLAIGPEAGNVMNLTAPDLTTGSSAVIGKDSGGQDIMWASVVAGEADGGIGISTQSSAASSVEVLAGATDYLSRIRAERGAEEARLGHTVGALRQAHVNAVSVESGIRDTDAAREMINLVKYRSLSAVGERLLAGQLAGRHIATA